MIAMAILNPIAAIVSLAHLVINIAIFFTVIRLILAWKTFNLLAHLYKVGRPLVDGMTNSTGKFIEARWQKKISEKCLLLISLLALMLADFVLTGLLL